MPKFIKYLILTISLFFTSFIFAEDIVVENAWIREAPPVSRVQAAYAIFKNDAPREIELINATSPAFKKIEFHQTILENGLSKMQQQASIVISKNSQTVLEPEGMHMMLFDPVKPLVADDKVTITFEYKSGNKITANFVVKKLTGSSTHHHHMHH